MDIDDEPLRIGDEVKWKRPGTFRVVELDPHNLEACIADADGVVMGWIPFNDLSPAAKETMLDLSRNFFLDVSASGHVLIRERGEPLVKGYLPVFSTETADGAEGIRTRYCRLARDRSGAYQLNTPPADYDALVGVADLFRAYYFDVLKAK